MRGAHPRKRGPADEARDQWRRVVFEALDRIGFEAVFAQQRLDRDDAAVGRAAGREGLPAQLGDRVRSSEAHQRTGDVVPVLEEHEVAEGSVE